MGLVKKAEVQLSRLTRWWTAQVVEVEGCELHPWSPEGFMRCMSGRRLILIGDSLMRQTFHSLACMLASVSTKGSSGLWDSSTSRIRGIPASLGLP